MKVRCILGINCHACVNEYGLIEIKQIIPGET